MLFPSEIRKGLEQGTSWSRAQVDRFRSVVAVDLTATRRHPLSLRPARDPLRPFQDPPEHN